MLCEHLNRDDFPIFISYTAPQRPSKGICIKLNKENNDVEMLFLQESRTVKTINIVNKERNPNFHAEKLKNPTVRYIASEKQHQVAIAFLHEIVKRGSLGGGREIQVS